MRFLLTAINAKYIHSNPAIYSLRAYAGEDLQSHIELAEYTINQRMQDILADIYNREPDCIGFSCYIWNWNMIRELLAELPKILPHTDIWLGGPEVSYDAPKVLTEFPWVRGIMVGEGEVTFKELLQWYVDREEARKNETHNNVIYMSDGTSDNASDVSSDTLSCDASEAVTGVVLKMLKQTRGLCLPSGFTPQRELTDMSALPFLYCDEDSLEPFENRIIYYESSRGCPYRCSYCLSSIDKRVRLRDIDIVKRELQFFLDRRVKQVKFVDRTFNCDHAHAMAIWQYLYEHDNSVTNFHFEISADILREEEIALLNRLRPGHVQLEIGVQSTNPETIKEINRTMDVDRLERIVGAIHEGHNIHLHLDLIAGLPCEDYDSFVNSFNRVYALKPEQLQLGFLKVLKGSPMEEKAQEYGIAYMGTPPYEVLYTKWLSYGDVLRLKKVEKMLEIYYNSNQFTYTIAFLEKVFSYPFALYDALADFYEEKGYLLRTPARVYRYEVLLEFACRVDGTHRDVYRELLTFDLYLRENAKSRPGFAKDLTEEKDMIRKIYQDRERNRMTHPELFSYPVWDMEGWREETPAARYWVLFDYEKRNPLNAQATIVQLDEFSERPYGIGKDSF